MVEGVVEVTTVVGLGIFGYAFLIILGILAILGLIGFIGNISRCLKKTISK